MNIIKLKAKYLLRVAGNCYKPGEVFEVPSESAKEMIRCGIATEITNSEPKKGKK